MKIEEIAQRVVDFLKDIIPTAKQIRYFNGSFVYQVSFIAL
jgi:hypothetical protein